MVSISLQQIMNWKESFTKYFYILSEIRRIYMIKYCPNCYIEIETDELVCPQCGAKLEEPFTAEEDEEMLELLMNEMRV